MVAAEHEEQGQRPDTRQRIQEVALELFAEHGYEKTSLREIAERLDVTKAALYYHFKTKEDILGSIIDDWAAQADEIIAWGESQPRTRATREELLRRHAENVRTQRPLMRFFQENQSTVRDLKIGERLRDRMIAMFTLISDPDAPLTDQLRARLALFSLSMSQFAMRDTDATEEELHEAAISVALELIR